MKIILLARVSTEEQKEAGNSLPAQMVRLKKYALDKGFAEKDLIEFEFDESAYKKERDKFAEVIRSVDASNEPIALCCDKIDRLIRNFTSELVKLEDYRNEGKIVLHFPSDNIILHKDSPATDLFRFTMGVSLAKYFSDSISDNVKRAFETKLKKGEWIGWSPFGYVNVTLEDDKKWIEIEPLKAKIVVSIYEWYATASYSMLEIKHKVREIYDLDMAKSQIDEIMKNPFYYGEMKIKGKLYPHHYDRVITKTLFDRVQEVKAGFSKKHFKYAGLPYLYRGLIRCAECGCSITPEQSKGHIYYHCTQYKGRHGAVWVKEEQLTEQLANIFTQFQIPEPVLQELAIALKKAHQDKSHYQQSLRSALEAEYAKYQTRIEKMYDDQLDGRITIDMYDKKYKEFREKQEQIRNRLSNLESADETYYQTVTSLLQLANKAPELFKRSEMHQKRELLQLTLQNLVLKGEKLEFNLLKPFDLLLDLSKTGLWLRRPDSNRQPRS